MGRKLFHYVIHNTGYCIFFLILFIHRKIFCLSILKKKNLYFLLCMKKAPPHPPKKTAYLHLRFLGNNVDPIWVDCSVKCKFLTLTSLIFWALNEMHENKYNKKTKNNPPKTKRGEKKKIGAFLGEIKNTYPNPKSYILSKNT